MANAQNFADFVARNYDLLADSDHLNEAHLSEEVSQEEAAEVNAILNENEVQQITVNDDSSHEFEDSSKTVQYATCNQLDINYFSAKKDKESTQQQTKWAVKVFQGNCTVLTQIFFLKQVLKFCSR